MPFLIIWAAWLALSLLMHPAETTSLRVLFVGNSFTAFHNLPGQLRNVANSFGDNVTFGVSTIGGCSLYGQMAEFNENTRTLLEEDWDYIVLQDHSILPTQPEAREIYMIPAIQDFVAKKKDAKVVLYLTWGYHDGYDGMCPNGIKPECFPLGMLHTLAKDPQCNESENTWNETVLDFPCMGYAVARGYLDMYQYGVDMVAPAGLAWQTVRDVQTIPDSCKALVDAEYDAALNLSLPFHVEGASDPDILLYNLYEDGGIDKHPNLRGQYLNALTIYATLFGKSPIGAAPPLTGAAEGWDHGELEDEDKEAWEEEKNTTRTTKESAKDQDGDKPLTAHEIIVLQKAAHGAVQQCGKECHLSVEALEPLQLHSLPNARKQCILRLGCARWFP